MIQRVQLAKIKSVGISLGLLALIWLVFGKALRNEFVNYDDQYYVYENTLVSSGITINGLVGAFRHACAGNWHPLTIISHMVDCELYGLKPMGHHLTSIVLHSAGAVLLFLTLSGMTRGIWRSAFVAAVFALH